MLQRGHNAAPSIGAQGSSPALSFLGLKGLTRFLLQTGGLGASPQKGLVAFWAGFRHWSPTGLGQGPGPCVPECPGGEWEGAGPCRDCLEQGGSTRGRAGAGSIHVSPPLSPEALPAAHAVPGVLCPFQPSLRRKGECAGAGGLCPSVPMASPVPWGWSWELLGFSSAPGVQLWLPGRRGHGWMADGG